jgi:glycosyltransferase involved in cell wall biosynthesis
MSVISSVRGSIQSHPASQRILRLLSDIRLQPQWEYGGDQWRLMYAEQFSLSDVRNADIVVIDGRIDLLARAVAAGFLHLYRKPIVAVDVVLRPPKHFLQAFGLRALFKRIDHFVHYFRDLSGYERFYGIDSARSSFVPFKVDLREVYKPKLNPGEYVLCFGGSMRDYECFLAAMAQLDLPGAISEITARRLVGTAISANVRVLKDDGSQQSLIQIIEGARIVALPIQPRNINASGLGTYLNAMWMGKPLILTQGPGVSDLLQDEALIIPAGATAALRDAIARLWNDEGLRQKLAEKGKRYAQSLGGHEDLAVRLQNAIMHWYYSPSNKS